MSSRKNGAPRWEVHASGLIARDLKRIQERAVRQGRGAQVLAAIRQIQRRLERDPRVAGEPSYYLLSSGTKNACPHDHRASTGRPFWCL